MVRRPPPDGQGRSVGAPKGVGLSKAIGSHDAQPSPNVVNEWLQSVAVDDQAAGWVKARAPKETFMTDFLSSPFAHTALALSVAFVLGGLIGLERQYRQRTAGLRTNVLVAVGAAAFVDLGARVAGADGSVRVISYVVSGIGFLGAGVIMKEGAQVRGLNTAATLWACAAVGAFAGAGQKGEAVLVAAFVLAGNC